MSTVSNTTKRVGKQRKNQSSIGNAGPKKNAGTRMHDWFIAIFGVAFLLSFSLNAVRLAEENGYTNDVGGKGHASNKHAARAALHRAMNDFKDSSRISSINIKEPRDQPNKKSVINVKTQKIEAAAAGSLRVGKRNAGGGDGPKTSGNDNSHLMELATLDCKAYGGPSPKIAQELVYWQDISSDSSYVSPFFELNKQEGNAKKYLTFEPDGGGWNNIRMAMESTIAMAVAMGRTLVMPPQKKMYLLGQIEGGQQHHFSFVDFFPIAEMAEDNKAFQVVSMKEYLEEEAMKGNLVNRGTGKVEFPPGNRTDWDGINSEDYDVLRGYLRNVSHTLRWKPGKCLPAFPSSGNHKDVEILKKLAKEAKDQDTHVDKKNLFRVDDPNPASRLEDSLAGRRELCVYDENDQKEQVVHFQMNHKEKLRLLVHFYGFLFFEDWREDLWMKRFVRDHLHYTDEIQCAAARIVSEVRNHVAKRTDGKSTEFDTFHIRRGDFQYKETRIDIDEIIKNTEKHLTPGSTIFIATDERNKNFFDPMKKKYDLLFLDDFKSELDGINSNYYGMIDQLVASRGRLFFGCWFSTFTGYIMRIRGYHSIKDKAPGYEHGELPTTYYYVTKERLNEMHKYAPLRRNFYVREYPTSWRDIDQGIKELASISRHR